MTAGVMLWEKQEIEMKETMMMAILFFIIIKVDIEPNYSPRKTNKIF